MLSVYLVLAIRSLINAQLAGRLTIKVNQAVSDGALLTHQSVKVLLNVLLNAGLNSVSVTQERWAATYHFKF